MDPLVLKVEHQYDMQHDHGLGSEHNADVNEDGHSPHGSPQQGYTNQFDFSSPTHTSFEHHYSSAPYQSYSAPQPLHPLNTTVLWPSQLTNPSTSSPPAMLAIPPRALAPATQECTQETTSAPTPPPPPPPPKSAPNQSNSRKTLTDNDRRRMCKYHEENPTVKQTEIGGESTVSASRSKY